MIIQRTDVKHLYSIILLPTAILQDLFLRRNDVLYRQVNKIFKEHFDFFISSGCYENLVKKELLIPHEIINENLTGMQ